MSISKGFSLKGPSPLPADDVVTREEFVKWTQYVEALKVKAEVNELLREEVEMLREEQTEDRKKHAKEIKRLKDSLGVVGNDVDKVITGITPGELVNKVSRRWRILGFMGGMVSPTAALKGYLGDNERWAWGAFMFWIFSATCLVATGLGNVRKIGNMSEKIIILFSVFLVGIAM